MSIYTKLMNVQNELKVPKNNTNTFGNYKFRNAEDILEALKPLLKNHNATVIITDDVVMVGDRYYIKATVKFIDTETGETIETSALAREEENKLRKSLRRIEELVEQYQVEEIVLGFPKNMNNTIGERAEKSRAFAERLSERTGLPTELWDERLTTVAAERVLMESGVRREHRKEYVDKIFVDEAVNELQTIQDMLRWSVSRFSAANIWYGHGTDNPWDEAVQLVLPSLYLPLDIPEVPVKLMVFR